MTIDQREKADAEQSQSPLAHDELNDGQLERVSAGSRPNRSATLSELQKDPNWNGMTRRN